MENPAKYLYHNPKSGIYTGLWACSRPCKPWTGAWPGGLLERIFAFLGRPGESEILQPFGGVSKLGTTVDLNRDLHPTVIADAQYLPFRDSSFSFLLLDPPYTEDYIQHYSDINQHLPRTKPKFSIYKSLSEASRVSSEYVILLHTLIPRHIDRVNYRRKATIGISTGPNKRIRCLSIFRRVDSNGKGHLLFEGE